MLLCVIQKMGECHTKLVFSLKDCMLRVLIQIILPVILGGTLNFLSRLVKEFNTFVFRKDTWGIILMVINIRVLWGPKVAPIGHINGR